MANKNTKNTTKKKTNPNQIIVLVDDTSIIAFRAADEESVVKELCDGLQDDDVSETTPKQFILDNFDRYDMSDNEKSLCIHVGINVSQKW